MLGQIFPVFILFTNIIPFKIHTILNFFQFTEKFHSNQACFDYFASVRWAGGVFCPFCNSYRFYALSEERTCHPRFKCANKPCRKKFSYTTGTVFENTKTPLRNWFFIMYQLAANKKSIASVHLSNSIGVTQTTAWRMMTKLREIFKQDGSLKLSGVVEIDECFIAKNHQWRKYGQIKTRKLPVIGLMERGSKKLITVVLLDRKRDTIEDVVRKYVVSGSTIYTDGHLSYVGLKGEYDHHSVNHSELEFVRGEVHTNSIENVWRNLKMNARNAHLGISQKHLQSYCDEITYRMNTRDMTILERFDDMLLRASKTKTSLKNLLKKKKEVLLNQIDAQ